MASEFNFYVGREGWKIIAFHLFLFSSRHFLCRVTNHFLVLEYNHVKYQQS
jgi:hypothetical protein